MQMTDCNYIEPLIDNMVAVMKKRTPKLIDAASGHNNVTLTHFADFHIAWTGVLVNPPECYVLAGDMTFDSDAQTNEKESLVLVLRASFTASTPEEKVRKALRYSKVLKDAVKQSFPMFPQSNGASDWDAFRVKDVFIPNLGLHGMTKTNDGVIKGFVDVPVALNVEELA